jgi:hypothetical protein
MTKAYVNPHQGRNITSTSPSRQSTTAMTLREKSGRSAGNCVSMCITRAPDTNPNSQRPFDAHHHKPHTRCIPRGRQGHRTQQNTAPVVCSPSFPRSSTCRGVFTRASPPRVNCRLVRQWAHLRRPIKAIKCRRMAVRFRTWLHLHVFSV